MEVSYLRTDDSFKWIGNSLNKSNRSNIEYLNACMPNRDIMFYFALSSVSLSGHIGTLPCIIAVTIDVVGNDENVGDEDVHHGRFNLILLASNLILH